MFWSTIGEEQIELEKKLDTPDCTLKMVLDDMYCLQEIRNSNDKLLSFLKKETVIRELLGALMNPRPVEEGFHKNKYRFVHQCCEAICVGVRELYPEFIKYDDLVQKMIAYLKNEGENLNPLCVSLYCRVIVSFLSVEPESALVILEKSDFLENCINSLEYSAIFELLCSIISLSPEPTFRTRVKQWYVDKKFADKLLSLFSTTTKSFIVVDNAAMLWCELIRALRDTQQNVERSPDLLLDTLQSEDAVSQLLGRMFPDTGSGKYDPGIISNGAMVLNTLLETNNIRNSPAYILSQEAQAAANPNFVSGMSFNDSSSQGGGGSDYFVIDAERVVETKCADRVHSIIACALEAFYMPPDAFFGDVMISCMDLLVNLVNTNFLPTHLELLRTLSSEDTSLTKLFEAVYADPTRSNYNASLSTMISYILYSKTGEQRPLITYLLKDFDLPRHIKEVSCDGTLQDLTIGTNRQLNQTGNSSSRLNNTTSSVFLEQDIQNMTFANFDDSSTPRDLLCPFAGDKDEKDEEKLGDSTADMFFAGDGLKDLANDPEIAGDKDEKDEEKLGDSTADMFKKCFGLKNLANDPEIDEFGDFAQAPKMEYLAQSAASKMEEPKVLKKELLEKDNLDDTAKLFDDLCEEEKGEKVVLNDTFGNEHTYRRIVDKANPIDPRNPAKGKPAEATDDDGTKVGIATDGIILSETSQTTSGFLLPPTADRPKSMSPASSEPPAPDSLPPHQSAIFRICKRAFFAQLGGRLVQSTKTSPNGAYIDSLLRESGIDDWSQLCSSAIYSSTFSEQNRTSITTARSSGVEQHQLIVDEINDSGRRGDGASGGGGEDRGENSFNKMMMLVTEGFGGGGGSMPLPPSSSAPMVDTSFSPPPPLLSSLSPPLHDADSSSFTHSPRSCCSSSSNSSSSDDDHQQKKQQQATKKEEEEADIRHD